ncbi:conserved hypothetical protein [Gammaproteobacteria bacterium]
MRVEGWNPEMYDEVFENATVERLVEAAEVVANSARSNCPVGTLSRPMYKRGPYAGKPWTARDAGALKKSIRVVQKLSKSGRPLKRKSNVRVYAGNYLVYYASVVEHAVKPFLRVSLINSHTKIKSIMGAE